MLVKSITWLALLGQAALSNAFPVTDGPALFPRQTGTVEPEVDVTQIVTVTDLQQNFSPTTVETTVFRTITSTIVVTSTTFATTTVTSSNVDTATVTNFVTTTKIAKRTLGLPEETGNNGPKPSVVEMIAPMTTGADWGKLDLVRRELEHFGVLAKRATVFETVTVTIIADGITTIFESITSTVIRTTTSNFVTTSLVTSVAFANAKTTVTVTSTLTVTSTSIDTSQPETTVAVAPSTGNFGPTVTGGSPSSTTSAGGTSTGSPGSGNSSGGLSTGAIAGIGGGVGAVVLIGIIGIVYWWWKKHSAAKKARQYAFEDMQAFDPNSGAQPSPLNIGMSEVPVGPPVGGAAVGMRKNHEPKAGSPGVSPLSSHATPAQEAPWRRPVPVRVPELGETRPMPAELDYNERPMAAEMENTQARPLAAEMGDTQTRPYAAEMGDTQARPYAAEMDSNPRPAHRPEPAHDVYEMPSQHYR